MDVEAEWRYSKIYQDRKQSTKTEQQQQQNQRERMAQAYLMSQTISLRNYWENTLLKDT